MVEELDNCLGPLQQDQVAYPIKGLEATLNYTMACVRENFRLNPVFSMNLWRCVRSDKAKIGDLNIPHGVSPTISQYISQCCREHLLTMIPSDQCMHLKLRATPQSTDLGNRSRRVPAGAVVGRQRQCAK